MDDYKITAACIDSSATRSDHCERRECIFKCRHLGKSVEKARSRVWISIRLRIVKALHGLVSSGRCFQMHLRPTLRRMGFEPSLHDDNLWVLKDERNSFICISVYVDDLMISGKQP